VDRSRAISPRVSGIPCCRSRAVAVGLLWWRARIQRHASTGRFSHRDFAGGFLVAALTRPLYGGTLRDPNGYRSVRIRFGSLSVEFDVNLPVVAVASALVVAAVALFWFGN
jgi:hypothetical protein